MVGAEDVPDRFAEFAGDFDAGDFLAALRAEPSGGALVVLDVAGVLRGVGGGFDERPAQILGPVLGERAASVALPRLIDPGTQPREPTSCLGDAKRLMSPISEAMVNPGTQATPGTVWSSATSR